jgi:hypothetical protein
MDTRPKGWLGACVAFLRAMGIIQDVCLAFERHGLRLCGDGRPCYIQPAVIQDVSASCFDMADVVDVFMGCLWCPCVQLLAWWCCRKIWWSNSSSGTSARCLIIIATYKLRWARNYRYGV